LFAPEIATKLSVVDDKLNKIESERIEFSKALKELKDEAIIPLTEQLKLHLGVESKQDQNMDKMNVVLDKINDSITLSHNPVDISQKVSLNLHNPNFKLNTISKYDVERRDRIKIY